MAAIKIRRAIGLMKDKTSIGIAKVAGNTDGDLEVLVVKVTSHDSSAVPGEKHLEEIVARTWLSKPCACSCVSSISKRLERTRDWVVALKALIVVHRLVFEGGKAVREEIAFASGGRLGGLFDLSGFRDEAHSNSWDYSEFVRSYAMYLGEKVRVMMEGEEFDSHGDVSGSEAEDAERVFGRMKRLQGLLDRVLSCRPVGVARTNGIVMAAISLVLTDSFDIYGDVCEGLLALLDRFHELGFENSALGLDLYVKAARQIDELFEYYRLCREIGVGSPASYPEVHRISDDLLKSLEEFLKMKLSRLQKSPERSQLEISSSNALVRKGLTQEGNHLTWMLPPPIFSSFDEVANSPSHRVKADLVKLEDNAGSAEEQTDEMTLTLFSETLPSDHANGERERSQLHSALQTDKVEADWELALVESASNLAGQTVELGFGFDYLTLNSMYDEAVISQHGKSAHLGGGSASSMLQPIPTGRNGVPILALPGPDGMIRAVNEDPFAASLAVPPPSYVQMAEMERKRLLLLQEQQLWQQYGNVGVSQSVMMNQNNMGKPGGYYFYS